MYSYDIMFKNVVEPDRPRKTMWHMRFACCIPRAANTESEYVNLIALPLLKLLHERAWMLGYTYLFYFVYT